MSPTIYNRDDWLWDIISNTYHQTQVFEWAHLKPSGFHVITTKHSVFWAHQKPSGFHAQFSGLTENPMVFLCSPPNTWFQG